MSHPTYMFTDWPQFRPDLSPLEMFQRGIFGGGYFRKIYSTVTHQTYEGDYKEFAWARTLDQALLTKDIYDKGINQYRSSCGLGLDSWQKKNWIRAQDPRGWVQWYCRFFEGRRSIDDRRQINRWLKIVRFKHMYLKKPSAKIKQVLLHWAYDPEKIGL